MLHDGTPVTAPFLSTLVEQGKTRWKLMQSAVNGNQVNVSQNFSCKKWFNLSNVKDNVDDVGALFTASPTTEARFVIVVGQTITATATTIEGMFTIDYSVLLFEPRELPQS